MATAVWTNSDEIRTALRFRVGQGTSVELLSDDELDECLNAARQEINRLKPSYTFSSFSTVDGQQAYDVVPAGALAPVKVFWRTGGESSCSDIGLFGEFGDTTALLIKNLMDGPDFLTDISQSRIEIVVRNIQVIRKYFGGRGWENKDGKIWLDPRPSQTGISVYYYAPVVRFAANTDLDIEFVEPFMDYAQMVACNIMAAKQSEVAETRIAFGKSIKTAGGQVYLRMAKDAERRFYNFMTTPGTMNHF